MYMCIWEDILSAVFNFCLWSHIQYPLNSWRSYIAKRVMISAPPLIWMCSCDFIFPIYIALNVQNNQGKVLAVAQLFFFFFFWIWSMSFGYKYVFMGYTSPSILTWCGNKTFVFTNLIWVFPEWKVSVPFKSYPFFFCFFVWMLKNVMIKPEDTSFYIFFSFFA